MKKSLALLLVALMLVGALAGCKNDSSSTGDEQVVNTYMTAEPKTLDPGLASDQVGGYILTDTMDSLTRLVSDGEGGYEFAPAGAKSWEPNADGTVWTFYLNDNKWSDGVAVTANDYVYALKRIVNPDTGAPLVDMLSMIKNYGPIVAGEMDVDQFGVEATDDSTLVITLESAVPFFLSLTYDRVFSPQRQDLVEEWGDKFGSDAQYTISNGPFKVETWVHNNQIVLVKNENYWDADTVKLDKVVYNIMTDTNTYLNAFDNGEIDTVTVPNTEWRDRFMDKEDVNYYAVPSQTLTYMFFNNADEVFQNENIRKAFMYGVDRDELNEMCFGSLRVPTYGWVVPSITVGEINYRSTVGDTVLDLFAQDGGDAKALLLEGMRELGLGDDPSTLNITFSLAGTDDWYQTLGAYLQQIYKTTLGIELKLTFNDWGIFYDSVQRGEYQIGFMGWGAFYNDPYDVLSLFVSSSNAIMTNWSNDEYDALIKEAMTIMDDGLRLETYAQAERIMLSEAAASPLACSTTNRFVQGYVKGMTPSTFGTEGWKFAYIEGK